MTKPLTSTQRAQAAASIRRLLEEIVSDDLEASDVERAYLAGVEHGLSIATDRSGFDEGD